MKASRCVRFSQDCEKLWRIPSWLSPCVVGNFTYRSRWFVLWFLCLDLRNRSSSPGSSDVCGNSRGFLHPSAWPAGNYTLRTLRWLAERSERSVSRRPFRNLCLHRRLETCRRSRRPLDRCFAAKGLFFACHRKFPFLWLVSRIVLAISSISGLHFHRSELRAVGSREIATMFSGGKCIGNLFRNCFGYFFGNRFGNPLRSFGVLSVCFMLDPRCQILGETARILLECTAVTKSGTGTWDGDVGRGRGTGTRRRRTGTRRRRTGTRRLRTGTRRRRTRGRGTRRLGDVELGDEGAWTWDSGRAGTRGRDQQATPEFVKYNSRWSRLKV